MSRLTWQQVANPNFSGSNDSMRLMTDLINRSTGGLDRAIGEFQEDRSRQASGELMRDTLALQDPEALRAALADGSLFAGRNAGAINPAAYNFAAGHGQRLLGERQTEAQTRGTDASTALTGVRTQDAQYGLGRRQTLDGREDSQYEARQRLSAIQAEAERMARAGDIRGAEDLMRQHEDDIIAANLPYDTGITTALSGQNRGQQMFRDAEAFDTFSRNARTARNSRELTDMVLAEFTNPAEAAEAIRSLAGRPGMSAEIMRETLTELENHPGFSPRNAALDQMYIEAGIPLEEENRREVWGAGAEALQRFVDQTEGAGNYDTLYGHAQRNGQGPLANTRVSTMTLDQLREFSSRNGEYGRAQTERLGYLATPMGRYQIVGDTLRNAARQMGLPGDTVFNEETQDAIFNHLVQQRLASANTIEGQITALRNEWVGFRNVDDEDLAAAIQAYQGGDPSAMERIGQRQGQQGQQGSGSPSTGSPEGQPPVDQMLGEAAGDEEEATRRAGMTPEEQAAADSASLARDAQTSRERGINPLVDAPEADTDNSEAVSIALQRALADNPDGFTDDQEGLDFLISQGIYPEGTTVDQVGSVQGATLAGAATAQMNRLREENGGEAPDTRSQFRRDWDDGRQRSNVSSEIGRIRQGIATGSSGPAAGALGGMVGSAMDYFTVDGDTRAQNNAARAQGAEAIDWFNSSAAQEHFQADPSRLRAAEQDPVGYAQQMLNDAAGEDVDTGATAPSQGQGEGQGQAPSPQQNPAQAISQATSIPAAISIARSTIAMDNVDNPYAFIDNMIISGEGMGGTPSEVADRLHGQTFGNIRPSDLANIVTRIMNTNDLPNDPGVVGALMEYAQRENPGMVASWFGSTPDVSMSSLRRIWRQYQDSVPHSQGGHREPNAPGIRRLEHMQQVGRTREAIDGVEARYDAMIAMRDQLRIQNTSRTIAQAERLEAGYLSALRQQLEQIVGSGISGYSDARVRNTR